MSTTKQPIKIPFTQEGRPLSYDHGGDYIVRKDNFVFPATLRYKGYSRGRSSALIELQDKDTGIVYDLFMSTFDDLMKMHHYMQLSDGKLEFTGFWTFCKKGQNYALKPVG